MKSLEQRTFRATTGAWVGEFALPLIFFVVLFHTAVTRAGLPPAVAIAALLLLAIVVSLEYLLPMLRSWIQFERNMLNGSLNGKLFHLHYAEIQAAWTFEQKRRRFLCIGTSTGTIIFPLHFFDEFAIWEELSLRLPQEVLGEQAIQRLPDYQKWMREKTANRGLGETPRAVTDHWVLQVLGWGVLTYASFSAVACFSAGMWGWGITFCVAALLSMLVLFFWGVTVINIGYVKRSTLFRSDSITWKEVVKIEKDPLGLRFVLVGDGCQLVIPGPMLWSSLGRRDARELFDTQIRVRGIPVQNTLLALVKMSHRTRMAR